MGQGLILWKPKGALIRRSLQDFITEELDKLGYSQVYTPNIGKLDLYRTSGHFPYYRESQYAPIPERDAMEKLCEEGATCAELFNGLTDGTIEGYMLKPMNCPHHIKIYANDAHSYRDLPGPPGGIRHGVPLGTERGTGRHDARARLHPG